MYVQQIQRQVLGLRILTTYCTHLYLTTYCTHHYLTTYCTHLYLTTYFLECERAGAYTWLIGVCHVMHPNESWYTQMHTPTYQTERVPLLVPTTHCKTGGSAGADT